MGQVFEISGRRWSVTDHSSYDNAEGYHVDEWECEKSGGGPAETAYLLRETGDEVRWYFTRPIPISAVSLSGGKPFADVVATLTEPPDALVYKGLAHGLDETTDGTYADEPGESVQKTTWDYWDAKQELNLAVERWADGRVECFHGRRIDPKTVRVPEGFAQVAAAGATAAAAAASYGTVAAMVGAPLVIGLLVFVPVLVFLGTVETALTLALSGGALVAFLYSLQGSQRVAKSWIVAVPVLALSFYRYPPLTSVGGLALLLLVPAAITWWVARGPDAGTASGARSAFAGVAAATLGAGYFTYYWFAPIPRSIGQYLLAIGPAPLAGLVACAIAWGVMKTAASR